MKVHSPKSNSPDDVRACLPEHGLPSTGSWQNLGELVLDGAVAFGSGVAFQIRRGFRIERTTFAEVGTLARKTASWLRAQGLVAGDRVAVWSVNMPEYAVLLFGSWLAGLVVVPVDIRTRQDVADRFMAAARPAIGFKSRLLEGRFGPPVRETYALEDLFDLIRSTEPLLQPPALSRDTLCEIAYTSGTTAAPKGVMLTHGNFLSETEGMQIAFPLNRSDRVMSLLPLSHVFEQAIDLLLTYSFGVSVTYVPRPNAATISRTLREESITCFVTVPELLRTLIAGIERRARDEHKWVLWQLSHKLARGLPLPARRLLFRSVHTAMGGHLRFIASGSAPLDLKSAETLERMGIRVFEGYGLTEVAAAATTNNWTAARLGSVGRPIPGVEVEIAGDGEILLRGGTVTPGYFDNPDLTARSFVDGWLRTGDVGHIDTEGFLHITGREAFRLVLSSGQKVYPEDLEQALNRHPLVKDSCVVGVDRDGGETVHAVLLMDVPARAAEVIREVNHGLAAHQQISGWTVWSDPDFPRTPLLKVDRKMVQTAVKHQQTQLQVQAPTAPTAVAGPLVSLIARITERPLAEVRDEAELGSDLGLDSLGMVELASAIEDDLGRVVDELRLSPETTVGELRRLVAASPATQTGPRPATWPRRWWARGLRRLLQWIAFRLQDHWMSFEVIHPERAANLPLPCILIFNYQGPYVPLAMLRAMPSRVRSRVAIAVSAHFFKGRDRPAGELVAMSAQGFPFATSEEGAVRPSLEEMGRWLDDGYAVIISPEGGPEENDQLRPFHGGAGLMAVEMGVPVIPFRVEGYGRLFPPNPPFPYFPNRKGRFRLIVGEALTFSKTTTYQEATERMRRALIETA